MCIRDSFYSQQKVLESSVTGNVIVSIDRMSGKDAYSTLASLAARAKLYGYRIRPKLHMMTHLVSFVCNTVCFNMASV